MSKLDTIFKKPLDEYKITLNPIKDYFDMGSDFLSTMTNDDTNEARDGLKALLKRINILRTLRFSFTKEI